MRSIRSATTLKQLRDCLASLFQKPSDVSIMLADIGIDAVGVNLQGSTDACWFYAICEVARQKRIRQLVERALEGYPDREDLRQMLSGLDEAASDESAASSRDGVGWQGPIAAVVRTIELREREDKHESMVTLMDLRAPFHETVEVTWACGNELNEYLVCLLPDVPVEETVDAFAEAIRPWRNLHPRANWSRLLYVGDPIESALRRSAIRHSIDLQSFAEYAGGLIDFRAYINALHKRLSGHDHYRPDMYIDARITRRKTSGDDETVERATERVREWMTSQTARLIIVLGDSGAGKSFLMRVIAKQMCEERIAGKPGPVPLLIEMRDFHHAPKLGPLLAAHLGDYEVSYRSETLRHMIREGQVALLFDGFDELAQRLNFDTADAHLRRIVEAVEDRAKVIVTSRKAHFHSDNQIRTALLDTIEPVPCVMAQLEPFTPSEVQQFIARSLKVDEADEAVKERLHLLEQVQDLAGLGQNPRMLSFIVKIPPQKLREAVEGKEGKEEVTAAKLYELLVDDWLAFERNRRTLPGALPNASEEQLILAVELVAVRLWGQVDRWLRRDDMVQIVTEVANLLPNPEFDLKFMAFQVRSGSLLTREGDDRFTFFHQSVMEWFVARRVARDWSSGQPSPLLAQRALTDLMPKFLVEMVGDDVAAKGAKELLALGGAKARENATRVQARLQKRDDLPMDLHGQDLREIELKLLWSRLAGAILDGCRLDHMGLRGVCLRNAKLRGAKLRYVDLTGADLTDADLTDADLTGARLVDAYLQGARFDKATLTRVSLVGAKGAEHVEAEVVAGYGASMSAQEARPMLRTPDLIQSVAVDNRRELIAAAGRHVVWILDQNSLTVLSALPSQAGLITSVAWSSDGTMLATGSADNVARVWRTEGELVSVLTGHTRSVTRVAFSPDGKLLATRSMDGTLRLWSIHEARELEVFNVTGDARAAVFGAADGTLVIGTSGTAVVAWDQKKEGKSQRTLWRHEAGLSAIAISPDGRLLASVSADGVVKVGDLEGKAPPTILLGAVCGARDVAVSDDGLLVACASGDGTVRVWTKDGKAVATLAGLQSPPRSISFCRDQSPPRSISFCGDSMGVVASSDDGSVGICGISDGKIRVSTFEKAASPLLSVAFHPDGKRLAIASRDKSARLWRLDDGSSYAELHRHHAPVRSVAFSHDGKFLATGSLDCSVGLWNVEDGSPRKKFPLSSNVVLSVAFSHGGRFLAAGTGNSTAILWDLAANREDRLVGHRMAVQGVAFSPHDTMLATASLDWSTRLWSLDAKNTWRCTKVLQEHQGAVNCVSFSPNGRLLATASDDRRVLIWSLLGAVVMRELKGHVASVRGVAFSPDGRLLATASNDRTVCLWDVETGQRVGELLGHEGEVRSVCFSGDGLLLATSSLDGTARVWSVSSQRCLLTCAIVDDAWVAFTPKGRFRSDGDLRGFFWSAIHLCRFDPGELPASMDLALTSVDLPVPARPTSSSWPPVVAAVSAASSAFALEYLVLHTYVSAVLAGAAVLSAGGARLLREWQRRQSARRGQGEA